MQISKRMFRLVTGIFLPPVLVVVFILGVLLSMQGIKHLNMETLSLLMVFVQVLFVGTAILSLVYSFLMEFLINPYLKNSVFALLYSMFLGIVASAIFSWLMSVEVSVVFDVIFGASVGLLTGLFLRLSYCRAVKEANRH